MVDSAIEKIAMFDLKCGTCTTSFITAGIYMVGYHFQEGIELYCPTCRKVFGRFEAKIPPELFDIKSKEIYGKIG